MLLCVDFIPDDTGKSQMLLENFKRKKKQLNIYITYSRKRRWNIQVSMRFCFIKIFIRILLKIFIQQNIPNQQAMKYIYNPCIQNISIYYLYMCVIHLCACALADESKKGDEREKKLRIIK